MHGIWMSGLEMGLLGRRLAACGFQPRRFRYHSLRCAPAENAEELATFARRLDLPRLHFVGHSLGGIVLLHLFARHTDLPPGRVVLLGCPAQGSGVARRLAHLPVLRPSLGRSVEDGLLGEAPAWRGGRELGVIAGTGGLGVGRLIGGLTSPSDGTVAVAETRLPGAKDMLTLDTTHTGMLFSRSVAVATARFLSGGCF